MKKHALSFVALVALLLLSPALFAFSIEEAYVYPFVDYLNWEERDDGTVIADEDGARAGIGVAGDFNLFRKMLFLRAKAELSGGDVDRKSPGIKEAITTYFGMKTEADVGWKLPLQQFAIEPFAGIGYDWWHKRIKNSEGIDSAAFVPGFAETWENYYVKVGVKSEWQMREDLKVFVEAGGKNPFYTRTETDVTGFGWTKLKPEGDWSAFAEIGVRYKWFRPSIFYEGLRYSASDPASAFFLEETAPDVFQISQGLIRQGKTDVDVVGFSFGFYFK